MVKHCSVGGLVGRFEAAATENQNTAPIFVLASVAIEIDEGFGKKAMIEQFVFLELDFGKENDSGSSFGRWQENAINAEGGFFDFDRFKAVVVGLGGWIIDEGKQECGESFEDLIVDRIAFHKDDLSIATNSV